MLAVRYRPCPVWRRQHLRAAEASVVDRAPTQPDPPRDDPDEALGDDRSPRGRRRGRVWLRRTGIGALVSLVALTAVSVVFNLATQPRDRVDPGFGEYVRVGSSEVHYQRWGDQGSPIVLVPGFLESSIAWSAVGPVLGKNHRVYALELPGHGYTRYAGRMTLSSQAELVDGFLRALHLHRPLLVGHSLGAAVAGSVALDHPRDVGSILFADGDGLPIDLGPRWLRAALLDSPYATTVLRVGARWPWAARELIKTSCGPSCPAATNALVQQWVRPLRQLSDEHALHDLMVNADYGLTPGQIRTISVPATIIWGSDDRQGGSLVATIRNLHHPPVHRIAGAGHLTMLADPEAFARAVESAAQQK